MSVSSNITPPLTRSSSVESSPVSSLSAPLFQRSKVAQIVRMKDRLLEDDQELAPEPFSSGNLPYSSPPPSPLLCDHSSDRSARSSSCSPSEASRSPSPRLSHHSSPVSSPPKGSARAHISGQAFNTFPRYRPYPPRGDPTPLQLRFAMKSMGPSSHLSMTKTEVDQGKDLLQSALSHVSQDILQKAYEAKRADRDTIVHRVAQTASEIESLERHKQFLMAIQLHQEERLATEESALGLVKAALFPRSLQEVEDSNGLYRAVFAEELVHLMTVETQLEHIGGVNPAVDSAPLDPNT